MKELTYGHPPLSPNGSAFMYKDNHDLDIPSDDTVMWRYLDFTKFISLLEK